ncbi:autotransporter outer membrane beta-barrel domain-containing protein [Terasakiella sp. SH-1]|uniref:autotransporter outer membrane beta-barrel domain-containing protein n=1 Tax=Terasakiella sp. SH-1 TaxID=2560057 RepID=UPI00107309B6|nr:autotransporter outer membrane beta-barrel domain-containing protein [Terasakiella sp. SH-1]
MKKFNTNKTFKKALLGGMSVVAFTAMVGLSSTALAADQELDNADGAAADGLPADADSIVNTSDDAADFLQIDLTANADDQITNIDSDYDGTLILVDGEATAANTLKATGYMDIASGTTFTIFMGNDTTDSSGNDALQSVTLNVEGTTGQDGASTLTRGGTLVIQGANDVTGDFDGTVALDGSVKLTALTATSGNGATDEGSDITVTLGDAAADTIDISTITLSGGQGNADNGGDTQVTVTGTLSDVTGGIDVNGGASAGAGDGGSSTITIAENVSALSGAVTVDGGSASAGGAGGAAVLDINGTMNATSNFTVTGGAASSGGAGNGGAASIDAEGAFTTTGTLTLAGGNGSAGGTGAGGAASADFNSQAVSVGGLTMTGGNGADTTVSGGGDSSIANVGALTIGSSGMTLTGGNGGGAAGASTGGSVTFTAGSTTTATGDITVTGGNGNDNDAADGGAVTAIFVDDVTATSQTLTITGGDGDADNDGDGGNASVEFNASATFSSIILNDGTAGNATAGTATLLIDTVDGEAETFTGAITAAADGEGTITIEGDTEQTFASQIGTSSAKIGTLTIGNTTDTGKAKFSSDVYATNITISSDQAANSAGNFDGNVTATTIEVDGSGNAVTANFAGNVTGAINMTDGGTNVTVTFDGSSAQTVSGAVTAAADDDGTVVIDNAAGVTFQSDIGTDAKHIKALTVNANKVATFNEEVFAKTMTISGTATFEKTGSIADTSVVLADNSKIIVGSGVSGVANGAAITGATAVIASAGGIAPTGAITDGSVTVQMPANFTSGAILLLDDTGGNWDSDANIELADFAVTDTALVDYTIVDGGAGTDVVTGEDADDLIVVATAKSLSTTASELGISVTEATALSNANTAVGSGDATALTALTTALNTGGSEATKAAEQVSVQADTLGAASTAAIGAGAQVVGVASNRLASLRSGAQFAGVQQTGFASGDAGMAKAAWVKPFGNWITQDEKSGVKGYDADTFGIAGGLDAEVADGIRLGGSFAYSKTDVDGKGTGNAKTDIKSYQFTVYGDYTTDKYYVEGMVGYARNNNDTSRQLTFGGLNRTAEGDYDSNQYMVSVGGGMPINLKGNAFITPMGSLSYTHVSSDSYTETGAGNLNLNVNPDDVDAFVASLGAKVHTKVKQGKGHLIPSATLGLSYDFSGDEATATGSYTGGGAAFTVEGAEVEQLAGNAGLGVTYDDGAWSVGANYDAEFKSDYTGHSATLEARFKF